MAQNTLYNINSPVDLRKLSADQLPEIAAELREFIIDVVAAKEGHLGASLGVVELTLALHYVFDTPKDQLVWDVGHQAYGHKILTGRREDFDTNRQLDGISGFPKRGESEYDSFGTGHSSTAISAALGMAIASRLSGDSEKQHIAVVGDASIASGMAFEGLNHAGVTDANLLVILNDNAIGIDPSVGALKNYLTKAKVGHKPKQDNIIEALNFKYHGPIDGHDLKALLKALEEMKEIAGPKFLHVITTKGKGLKKAEEDQVRYHAPGKFDRLTGEILPKDATGLPPKFQDVFGRTLVELAAKNEKITAITPAMPTGSSLKYMMEAFPERAFDVGIAEQHAVTLSAGMATQGLSVFCAIYSTFLQRAYDQVIHDVALQNLPVVFCLDRAGLVGEDGATHHGIFDIAYLRCIPNMRIFAPLDELELRNMLYTAQLGLEGPLAIRYPRGRGVIQDWQQPCEEIPFGKGIQLKIGAEIAVLSIGFIGQNVAKAIQSLENVPEDFGPSETDTEARPGKIAASEKKATSGREILEVGESGGTDLLGARNASGSGQDHAEASRVAHYAMRFVKPLDEELLHEIFRRYRKIITVEEGAVTGGFGSAVLEFAAAHEYLVPIVPIGIPDEFIEQGKVSELHEITGISIETLSETLRFHLNKKE